MWLVIECITCEAGKKNIHEIENLHKTIEVLETKITQCIEINNIETNQKQDETFQCKECSFIGKNESN